MCSGIGGELQCQREHTAAATESEPRTRDYVARGIVGEEGFAALPGPFHRKTKTACRPHHRHLLGINIEA